MSKPGTTISTQTTMFEEIEWDDDSTPTPLPPLDTDVTVSGAPRGLKTNLTLEVDHPPYWIFSYQLNTTSGLRFSEVRVKDSQSSGSIEQVMESIEFADFTVTFTDGETAPFDLTSALADPRATFQEGQNGTRVVAGESDDLFQRGIQLVLFDNIPHSAGGTCEVTLELSCIFRGAANDFDPGGVPVTMDLWPQVAFTWKNSGAAETVKNFRCSVKFTAINKMFSGGPASNVLSLYTDSNTSMTDNGSYLPYRDSRAVYYSGSLAVAAKLSRNMPEWIKKGPVGWAMVFDYNKIDIGKEVEVTAVYGPNDGSKFTSTKREETYEWIPFSGPIDASPGIHVRKARRQGMYDNIHMHARMMTNDLHGNTQIHAPFCGHSCMHSHWRWSTTSENGAVGGRGWKYRGWSTGQKPTAYAASETPLIPPNQKLKVAVCQPGAVRHSDATIVHPTSPKALDSLSKLMWYQFDIDSPIPGEKQVVFEMGMGWAYRYAMPSESGPVRDLVILRKGALDPIGITQADVSALFADTIYPWFRYKLLTSGINQIPEGSRTALRAGGTGISMEDL